MLLKGKGAGPGVENEEIKQKGGTGKGSEEEKAVREERVRELLIREKMVKSRRRKILE